MNFKQMAVGFVSTGLITFVVSLVVTWVYNAIAHGGGMVDWDTSVRLALIFGITLPAVRALEGKKKG